MREVTYPDRRPGRVQVAVGSGPALPWDRMRPHEYPPGTGPAFRNDDRPEVSGAGAASSARARTLEAPRTRLG
jgi:hypothetical protein